MGRSSWLSAHSISSPDYQLAHLEVEIAESLRPCSWIKDDKKRNMVMVDFDTRSGAPTRFCLWDPDTGIWVSSDA
jgi:hypothetical protein